MGVKFSFPTKALFTKSTEICSLALDIEVFSAQSCVKTHSQII
ncbi:hypothetical protein CFELI_07905 [Corynebacterium felinum]|uniref:Uncharacterized protein n=1 Tax=Corynebacterium felinum TaxID=131318 RepID=A0ABU2BDN7_9CORY|nr:hypothetical protein [Corynebacterium felinum]WJY95187.1 hypothetical protein CFELI_07905 [Corynebacterium felinum]